MAGILTFGSNRRLPRNAPSDIYGLLATMPITAAGLSRTYT